ncbi:SMP-30/gluconolactonase/LRE family protein [Rhodobacter sp. NSM]|uniref:SMP-30/gluconolactonase/LRE family protein n=1 Tax=Rhodobacter sp. NSM TaxID=3457501 RepID=UPI003FD00E97
MTATVFDSRPCFLGEGPLWHPIRRELFWFDILAGRLLAPGREWTFGEPASAAGWVDAETLLVATASALIRFDVESGRRDPIAELEADNRVTRSNDGRADPCGGFWIGTMGRQAEPGAGSIYRWYRGELVRLHEAVTIPNSICFAPGGDRAYFSDTTTSRIMTQRLDAEGWPAAAPEVFADLSAEGLHPDGAVTDAEGCLWNAQWGAGRIARYRPDGDFERSIPLPVPNCTCPAFGDGVLYVTTAREGLGSDALAAAPLSGQTFRLAVEAKGRAEPSVIL